MEGFRQPILFTKIQLTSIKIRNTIIFLVLFSICHSTGYAQNHEVYNIDVVIAMDDRVVLHAMTNPIIHVMLKNNEVRKIDVDYYPGNLRIKEKDFQNLLSIEADSMLFRFSYNEYCNDDHQIYFYDYPIGKQWLRKAIMANFFTVLRYYNTDRGRFQEVFDPLEGKTYTYEVDIGSQTIGRIRKKEMEDNCK